MTLTKLVRPECDTCNAVGPYQATSALAIRWARANGWRPIRNRSNGLMCAVCAPPRVPAGTYERCPICGIRQRQRTDGTMGAHQIYVPESLGTFACNGEGRRPGIIAG